MLEEKCSVVLNINVWLDRMGQKGILIMGLSQSREARIYITNDLWPAE